jgi:hypothetical protein
MDEYNQISRPATTTKETIALKKVKADLMELARDQDIAGFEEAASQAVSEGRITGQQVKAIIKESQIPPGLTRFSRLPLEWKLRTWEAGNEAEKEAWQPYFLKAIMAEKPENLIKLREPVVAALESMGPEFANAAQKVNDLTIPEKGTRFDLAGLGIVPESPQMGGMSEVAAAISQALGEKVDKLGMEKGRKSPLSLPRLSFKEKNNPYKILGI